MCIRLCKPLTGLAAGGLLLVALPAAAEDSGPTWHAFLTTGIIASDNDQAYDSGLTRRADLSRLTKVGLLVDEKINARWEFATQILAEGDLVVPDWAFVTYYPVKGLSLRGGKQRAPMWLYSDHLEVGHTYPWVTPPEEVYQLCPMQTLTGFDATYTIEFGHGLELNLDILGSPQSPTQTYAASADGGVVTTQIDMHNVVVYDASIGNDHFMVRGSFSRGTATINNPQYRVPTLNASFGSVGLKVDYDGLLLLSELAFNAGHVDPTDLRKADQAALEAEMQAAKSGATYDIQQATAAATEDTLLHSSFVGGHGFYATAGYQFGDFLPYATYARLRAPNDSLDSGSQDSASGGGRYDINLMTDLKVQAQHIWPKNGTHGLFDYNPTRTTYAQGNVYSAAVDVAF